MTVGTKSLLFGVHQFALHPILIFIAWWRIYGFPWDPRLWVAFIVHDWGYWGCPNMDGPLGELHPELGAKIMHWLFDRRDPVTESLSPLNFPWYRFMYLHSRFLSAKLGEKPSRLCWADKLVITMYPKWLYWVLSHASGEIYEYISIQKHRKDLELVCTDENHQQSFDEWWEKLNAKMKKLVQEETHDHGTTRSKSETGPAEQSRTGTASFYRSPEPGRSAITKIRESSKPDGEVEI